jgi:hypothetical protein
MLTNNAINGYSHGISEAHANNIKKNQVKFTPKTYIEDPSFLKNNEYIYCFQMLETAYHDIDLNLR